MSVTEHTTKTDRHATFYLAAGPEDGPLVIFVHGWPDDATLWRLQVAALKQKFRCVSVTLPNFGATADLSGGCDFAALVDKLARTIERAQADAAPVALVTHDWGAYIGYMYEKKYPERVRKMVALDIGGHVKPASARDALMMAGYQWILIGCWVVGGIVPPLGNWLTRKFAALLRVPRLQAGRVRSRCNYPYFYLWRGIVLPSARRKLLGYYKPACPVLFIYGGNKPLMFHSDRWLEILEKTSGRSECIAGGAHWFMETHPEEINGLIDEWLG